MRFHSTGQYAEGVSDVDPIAAPTTIIRDHALRPPVDAPTDVSALFLALMGISTETLTVDLYFLVTELEFTGFNSDLMLATTRWLAFDTALVITNGTLATVTAGLPAGGTIYARRTADTIGSSETRSLMMAWA